MIRFQYENNIRIGAKREYHSLSKNFVVVSYRDFNYTHRLLHFTKLVIKSILFFFFLFWYFNRDFKICLAHVFFKLYPAMQHFQPALNIFQSEANRALIQFLKIRLSQSSSIVMEPKEAFVVIQVLGEMDEACITMFQDIVDQLLDDPE